MLNSEREKLVVDLYKNQNKSIREIAQEVRMSFRDIGAILRKAEEANNGNAIDNGKGKKSYSQVRSAISASNSAFLISFYP